MPCVERWLGFEAPAFHRMIAAGMFLGLTAWLGYLAETVGGPLTPGPSPAAVATARTLTIEATYPVVQWLVQVGGQSVAGQADDQRWHGRVTLAAGDEALVRAEGLAPDGRLRGLRWRLDDAPDALLWGRGDLTATVVAP